jgi:hypothetical protein
MVPQGLRAARLLCRRRMINRLSFIIHYYS